MQILTTVAGMRAAARQARASGKSLGLIPTMGALHEGHASLLRAAAQKCGAVAASIFVNPTQFGPSEDFSRYPRSLERDCEMLRREGADFLFAPLPEEIYPKGFSTYVTVEGLSERLDGRSRPGHFRGVTTVVAKLFDIVQPDFAFFGQKDAAQHAVIRQMTRDLNLPVNVMVCPIVREPDGLAMSSRNAYLSPSDRRSAAILSQCLQEIERTHRQGERASSKLISAGYQILQREPAVRLDYLEIVDPDTLLAKDTSSGQALVAIAAFVGNTRLIDNLLLL
jgi:pantoate--beta-alanine ligase